MKVTYLYHSGFSVELEKHVLVFDYFKGSLPRWDKDKTILAFASHKHGDHFSFKIFDLISQYKKVHYFLGSDIRLSDAYLARNGVEASVKEKMSHMGKNKALVWEDVRIETLRSTDAGVAFMVEAEGKNIYHAGDLNWWHWDGESEAWNRKMAADYRTELEKIKGRHFDAAFVPLDPRLESAYDKGMNLFFEMVEADRVFPMHMWEQYEWIARYKTSREGSRHAAVIADIERPGQEFLQ